MADYKHRRRPSWCDWRACYIAEPPSATMTGRKLQKAWSNMSQWRTSGLNFMYSGPPDTTLQLDGSENGDFYIIWHMPDEVEAGSVERQIVIDYLRWYMTDNDGTGTADTRLLKWYDPHDTGSPVTLLSEDGTTLAADAHTYGDKLDPGWLKTYYTDIDYDPIAGDFRLTKLRIEHTLPAAVSLWHAPHPTLNGDQLLTTAGNMASGIPIRGYDNSDESSLGGIIHRGGEGAGDATHESAEAVTRRTLFQWGHPQGVYHAWAGASWDNMFGSATWKVKRSDLTDNTDHECYPAMVVDGVTSSDVQIRFTSATAGDTWTWTAGGAIAVPTLVKYSDGTGATTGAGGGLMMDDFSDEITISATGLANDELVLRTVALFEGPAWD